MGLFDFFKKVPIEEKTEEYANKGMVGKLCALADGAKPKETRLAALNSLRLIKYKDAVECLCNALRDPDIEIRTVAATSLLMNGTKDKTELLLNYSDAEKSEGNTELAEIMKRAAIDAKDRTPRV